jgi:hypothetical protein
LKGFFTIGTIRESSPRNTKTKERFSGSARRRPGHHLRHRGAVRRDSRSKHRRKSSQSIRRNFRRTSKRPGGKYILACDLNEVLRQLPLRESKEFPDCAAFFRNATLSVRFLFSLTIPSRIAPARDSFCAKCSFLTVSVVH